MDAWGAAYAHVFLVKKSQNWNLCKLHKALGQFFLAHLNPPWPDKALVSASDLWRGGGNAIKTQIDGRAQIFLDQVNSSTALILDPLFI